MKHSSGGMSSLLPSSIFKTEVKTEIKTEPEETIVINSDSDGGGGGGGGESGGGGGEGQAAGSSGATTRPGNPSTPGPVNVNVNVNLNFQEVPPGFDLFMRSRASSTSSQQGDGKYSLHVDHCTNSKTCDTQTIIANEQTFIIRKKSPHHNMSGSDYISTNFTCEKADANVIILNINFSSVSTLSLVVFYFQLMTT